MNKGNLTITSSVTTSVIFLMMIASISYVVDCTPNTAIVDYKCDPQQWTSDDYKVVVGDLINDLEYDTPLQQGYSYYHSLSLFEVTVYGYAECNNLIADYDCTECLRQAGADLSVECPMAIAADMELADCYMVYSNSPISGT